MMNIFRYTRKGEEKSFMQLMSDMQGDIKKLNFYKLISTLVLILLNDMR